MTNDEAEKLARELKASAHISVFSGEITRLCDHILSGDMKREIENAAYRRTAEWIKGQCNGAIGAQLLARDLLTALIQPLAQKENGE